MSSLSVCSVGFLYSYEHLYVRVYIFYENVFLLVCKIDRVFLKENDIHSHMHVRLLTQPRTFTTQVYVKLFRFYMRHA